MKDGFSTQIHIRQNDIGQFGKSGQDAVQKIVIFPTCILQIVPGVNRVKVLVLGGGTGNQKRSNQKVENLVESVEFHRQNRL